MALIGVLFAVVTLPTHLTHARAIVLCTLPAILDVTAALVAAVHAPPTGGTFWSKTVSVSPNCVSTVFIRFYSWH